MNKLVLALLAVSVSACTTVQPIKSNAQNYRLKGDDQSITITGDGVHKIVGGLPGHYDTTVNIYINGDKYITGKLDQSLSGELQGQPFNGKPTAANCTSKQVSKDQADVNCMVFIDNERTVTLTF